MFIYFPTTYNILNNENQIFNNLSESEKLSYILNPSTPSQVNKLGSFKKKKVIRTEDRGLLTCLLENVDFMFSLLHVYLYNFIPVNPPPFRGSLPRKSLISRMDWVSCAGDINLPHTPFPPGRSPPTKKSSTIKS